MEVTTLEVLDVIGTWIAAIGTVGAVITSLWLSYNSNKIKLQIMASSRIIIDSLEVDRPVICNINIVNIGNKAATVNLIGWEIKRGKIKRSFYQSANGTIGDKTPITLLEGNEANIIIEFNGKNPWITQMAKHTQGFRAEDLKVVVGTSTSTFTKNIDDSLVKEIKKERLRVSNEEIN
jgi:hypothetical protein